MITGLIITFAYLVVSFGVARRAYRHEYKLIYGSPAPQYYGGKHGHAKAHEVACREACWWLVMWPFFCSWAGIDWLISHGTRQSWVERDNEISRAQSEVDRLAAEQDPLRDLPVRKPCPCGYLTECPIHCGDGSECHPMIHPMPSYPEIIVTAHPEKIIPLDALPHSPVLAPGECLCPKCRPDLYIRK